MRLSLVLPSAVAAVVIVAVGSIWADAAGHHTVAGRPVALGATDSATSAAPTTSLAPSPTIRPTSSRPRPTITSAVPHSTVPYRAPSVHKRAVAHSSCSAASAPTASSIELAVFTMLNRERAENGLCPMHWSSILQKVAHGQSTLMDQKSTAADCSDGNYSHQYPGEASTASRIVAAGYPPGPIAETVGCAPDPSTAGAYSIQQLAYDEKPGHDPHRRMFLSTTYGHVGISIVIDLHDNTLWLTEDFAV